MLFSRQRPLRSADKLKPLTDPIKASEITAGMTNQHVITHASLGDSGEAVRHHKMHPCLKGVQESLKWHATSAIVSWNTIH